MILPAMRRALKQRCHVEPGATLLIACSGGPDSVALVHALWSLRSELSLGLQVASVDHGLRSESALEVERVASLAESLSLPFHGLTLGMKPGADVQRRAREERYAALQKLREALGMEYIAVGHHLDDQAETVLQRILRGSGIRGLSGIRPRRDDGVVRPLCDCSRSMIDAYVVHHGLPTILDPSNGDPRYERARVRAELLPSLAREDERVVEHLGQLGYEAQEIFQWIDELSEEALRLACAGGEGLCREVLKSQKMPIRKAVIRRWLLDVTGQSPARSHVEALLELVEKPGDVWLPGRQRAVWAVDKRQIVLMSVGKT